jgi:hypothetical protein
VSPTSGVVPSFGASDEEGVDGGGRGSVGGGRGWKGVNLTSQREREK